MMLSAVDPVVRTYSSRLGRHPVRRSDDVVELLQHLGQRRRVAARGEAVVDRLAVVLALAEVVSRAVAGPSTARRASASVSATNTRRAPRTSRTPPARR